MIQSHAETLRGLSGRWRNLEYRIKEAEQITDTVVIASINELRYTGRRFLDAWLIACKEEHEITDEDRLNFQIDIKLAEQYFNNADYDLSDSLIAFFSQKRTRFLDKYGIINATRMYPRLVAWIEKVEDAQEVIRLARRERGERNQLYKKLEEEHIPYLIENFKTIVVAEVLYIRKAMIERVAFWTWNVVTFIGVVASILTLWGHWDLTYTQLTRIWGAFY